MIYTKDSDNKKEFYWDNNKYLGYAYQEVDGFYVFYFGNSGVWAAYQLRAIADKVDELNAEWDEQVENYFKRQRINVIR